MRITNKTKLLKGVLFVTLSLSTYSSIAVAKPFSDSNLPIIIISTIIDPYTGKPAEILDDPKVDATMTIIKRPDGSRNYLSDADTKEYINYTGKIGIELRGSSSQFLDKKPYGFTTYQTDSAATDNVKILGMPSEHDWVLNALNFDPSLMRDFIAYNLARRMGNYATRTVYCEVVVNNDYKGLYLLQEKIKVDENRVNIAKMSKTDNVLPKLSGGYIVKADKTTGGDPVAWTMNSYSGYTEFIFDTPKVKDISPAQDGYIEAEFRKLETAARQKNSTLKNGYPTLIDIPSFIDFMLISELSSNPDSYQYSTFFHKDREGKLRAGPIWDYNLTYGYDIFMWGLDRSKYYGWQFNNGDNDGAKFWQDLFMEPSFNCYFTKRWYELIAPGQPMNSYILYSFIDSTSTLIGEAAQREQERWQTVENLPNSLLNIKTFIYDRTNWISQRLGAQRNCSAEIPSLVISKIHYHPTFSAEYPSSEDQEFIEIQNTGASTVNLSGIYLRELGVSYQFPYNSILLEGQALYLAGNSTVFAKKYGITAFGQFARNLPNSSHKLILSDAFGNTIDEVDYSDEAPWPIEADGTGSFLQLKSAELDNNIASNWIATNTFKAPTFVRVNLVVYPNPATSIIHLGGPQTITFVQFYDLSGRLVAQIDVNAKESILNIENIPSGFYLLRITDASGSQTQKIVIP